MSKGVIIEIRAGAGGDEAALFVADLFKMYSRFAEKQDWKSTLINSSSTGIGGYKELIFEIKGENVCEKLKHEGGVHRVQRIPITEKSGRIHTSTVSVAIMQQATETEIHINPGDLRVDVLRSSGPGGQNVNKIESAVRITHLPTGLVVNCQDGRSQQHNKEKAMQVLRSRLFAKKKAEELSERGDERREQIGTADRSEKIRTYNFPQNRLTDHRIKKSWHNLDKIMEGNLEKVIKIYEKKNF
ncbi:MAG: PCRF domain-containing protein [Patescibacteria group bacterium]